MRNLQEATEMICDLKGSLLALDALVTALLGAMTPDARHEVEVRLDGHAEVARNVLLHASISEHTIAAFERDVRRFAVLVARH